METKKISIENKIDNTKEKLKELWKELEQLDDVKNKDRIEEIKQEAIKINKQIDEEIKEEIDKFFEAIDEQFYWNSENSQKEEDKSLGLKDILNKQNLSKK
jgi:ribosomal protein L17